MSGIINSFKWIINFFKTIWGFISTILTTIAKAFEFLIKIINMVVNLISDLPIWLKTFALMTLAFSIIYFIIGRNTGKSD